MVATFKTFSRSLAAIACLALTPAAYANSSSNADIAAPLRAAAEAQQAVSGGQDDRFSALFNNWRSLEKVNVPALAAVAEAQSQAGVSRPVAGFGNLHAQVSIPSRMPLAGLTMTSDYGMRIHPVTGRRAAHKGIDLAAPTGTPIYATADGMVSRASWFSTYGLYVAIEHGGQLQTRYAHMSRLNVAEGQRVSKGDVIGYVGTTGRSTGPHLHYEVRVDGEAVNPVPYMNGGQIAHAESDASLGRGGN
ncbi:MAG: M23 family metallopeptidase [Novosphingobium sp.]|nr:M23 family metallopeptidase [Novosphingobium sp.]